MNELPEITIVYPETFCTWHANSVIDNLPETAIVLVLVEPLTLPLL